MILTPSDSLADALLDHPGLIPLLSRFGIPFGVGDKSIKQICDFYEVDLGFFLAIANTYIDPAYEEGPEPDTFPLAAIISYIKNTHAFYTETALPFIEKEIGSLLGSVSLNEEHRKLLSRFFNDYKNEFFIHIRHEEEVVIPYIQDMELRLEGKAGQPERFGTFTILEYAREHDRLEKSLNDLAKLIIKYLPPVYDQDLCSRILGGLFTLEKDLVEHAKLEDKVLVPRVLVLEKKLSAFG